MKNKNQVIKCKPIEATEVTDPKIIRDIIAEITRKRSPEEWAAIKIMREKRAEHLKRAMGK